MHTFLDLRKNFNSPAIAEDNLLAQFKSKVRLFDNVYKYILYVYRYTYTPSSTCARTSTAPPSPKITCWHNSRARYVCFNMYKYILYVYRYTYTPSSTCGTTSTAPPSLKTTCWHSLRARYFHPLIDHSSAMLKISCCDHVKIGTFTQYSNTLTI
jgi:hypothetical protein